MSEKVKPSLLTILAPLQLKFHYSDKYPFDNSKLLATNWAVQSMKILLFTFLTIDGVYELLFRSRLKCHIDEVW